jgi:hypothetical protein
MSEVTECRGTIFINPETQKTLKEITFQIATLMMHKELIIKTLIQQTQVDLKTEFRLTEDFTKLIAGIPEPIKE